MGGFPGGTVVKNQPISAGDARDTDKIPWVEKIPCRWKWQQLQYSCLKNPLDRGAWQATGHGVTKSQT